MSKCKICKFDGKFDVYIVKELELGLRDKFEYLFCPRCGCLQISEIPLNLSEYYTSRYYSLRPIKIKKRKNIFKKLLSNARNSYELNQKKLNLIGWFLSKRYSADIRLKALARIKNFHSLDKNSKILDIGCGNGDLLIQLSKIGFKYLNGLDPYVKESLDTGNIKIYKKSILNFNCSKKYDLIMFNHSFEHLIEDPFEVLKKVHNLLTENGLCLIRMPTTSSYLWELYKEHWVGIQAPRHIIIYSIRGFEILASVTGFTIDMIFYDSTEFSLIASEQYKRDIALNDENSYFINPQKSIFSKKDILRFKKLSRELNEKFRGDMIGIVMRKKNI